MIDKGIPNNFKEIIITEEYPEIKEYKRNDLYKGFIGCGGLYLATKMVRQMNLKKGDVVLDLGCGFGSAAIFLARKFEVKVIAVDLWISPDKLLERIKNAGISDNIIPLKLDITQNIPFANNYFDAIFCMNSFFLYGNDKQFIKSLLDTLKSGGVFCIGSECFNKEPRFNNKGVPKEFDFNWNWDVWISCYSKYHSPKWWHEVLKDIDQLNINHCEELKDGRLLWEDLSLNYYEYIDKEILSTGTVIPQEKLIEQINYGKEHDIYLTLYVMSGTKL